MSDFVERVMANSLMAVDLQAAVWAVRDADDAAVRAAMAEERAVRAELLLDRVLAVLVVLPADASLVEVRRAVTAATGLTGPSQVGVAR